MKNMYLDMVRFGHLCDYLNQHVFIVIYIFLLHLFIIC